MFTRNHRSSVVVRRLLVACLVTTAPSVARATPVLVATETMIADAQANNWFLASLLGIVDIAEFSYTSVVAPSGLEFSYSLVPGTTYEGLALSLLSSGVLDSASGRWTITMAGAWGPRVFDGETAGEVADDPDGGNTIVIEGDEFEERDGRRVKTGDKHLRVKFFPNGTSESTGHRTDAAGNKIADSEVKGKDRLNPDTKRWEDVAAAVFGLDSPIPVAIISRGDWEPGGGPGSFTTRFRSAPEPAVATLMLVALVSGVAARRRRKELGAGSCSPKIPAPTPALYG